MAGEKGEALGKMEMERKEARSINISQKKKQKMMDGVRRNMISKDLTEDVEHDGWSEKKRDQQRPHRRCRT